MSLPCVPEQFKLVEAIEPKTDAAGSTGDYVSLKNVHLAVVVVHITQGNALPVVVGLNEATAVAPTGAVAVTATFPIWSNLDCAASDTLVRQTDVASYSAGVGLAHKIVVLQFDPRKLSAGFDCIAVTTGASHAANLISAMYYLYERYQQATPPSAILD